MICLRLIALLVALAWLPSGAAAASGHLARASYQGPGDISAFTMWWGLRAFSAAVAATGTQNALDLRRASDNATCTAQIGVNGNLDLTVGTPCNGNTQTVTAWVGASTAFVSKIYDQTNGNACGGASCDLVQASAGAQPKLHLTGAGSGGNLPFLEEPDVCPVAGLKSANNFTSDVAGLHSLVGIGNRISGTGSEIMHLNTPGDDGFSATSANNWAYGTLNAGATDGTWHIGVGITNNGASSSTFALDGSEVSGIGGFTVAAHQPSIISTGCATAVVYYAEAGVADNTLWSSTIRDAICHNGRAYWGTPGTC